MDKTNLLDFDRHSPLWNDGEGSEEKTVELKFEHWICGWKAVQEKKQCVRTCLSILTGQPPQSFVEVNTQDPVSWSQALKSHGLKLAYCSTDIRKIAHYAEELIALDGLFALSYYTCRPSLMLAEPKANGMLCSSHIVILHRDVIYDPMQPDPMPLRQHPCLGKHTKRIFRVVPFSHPRGL